jgi:hypothetical protein
MVFSDASRADRTCLMGVYPIDSEAFAIAWKLALLFAGVLWLGVAFWVWRDARRRIDDRLLVGTAAILGLVPLAGPLVYVLFRPPEYLAETRLRDAELRLLEQQLGGRARRCGVCRATVEPEYLVCPVCTTRLKQACGVCEAPLEPLWQTCPYCATPVGAVVVQVDLDAALTAEAAERKKARRRPADTRSPAA